MTMSPATPSIERIAVMTSGGDSPGMNASIRAVVRYALHFGIEVMGIQRGYFGLVNDDLIPLGAREVGGKIQEGGTFLRSARLPEFKQPEVQQRALDVLARHHIDGLVVIGGTVRWQAPRRCTIGAFRWWGSPRASTTTSWVPMPPSAWTRH